MIVLNSGWFEVIGEVLTVAVKLAALVVIWYCGLAIRRISRMPSESTKGTSARPSSNSMEF